MASREVRSTRTKSGVAWADRERRGIQGTACGERIGWD